MFKKPPYQRPPKPPLKRIEGPLRSSMGPSEKGESVEKEAPVRSEAYRRYVASLPCWLCGIVGSSQAAHGDARKGLALKSSDLTCYPLCGPNSGVCGCHYTVGSTGLFKREERRSLEIKAAEETIATLILMSHDDHKLRALLVKLGLVK